jgi:regulatory protein
MFRTKWKRGSKADDQPRAIKDPVRSRERTMNRAVKLLAAKPRSVLELRERLLEKMWTDEEIVDSVIEKLKEYRYLDDQQFAKDLAVSKLRQKPQGKRRLKQTLSQKKLDKEVVEQAMVSAFEKLPEAELIDRSIEKRLRLKGKPETREDLKKFYDHLLRQGFGFDLIREKMQQIGKTPDETDE